MSDTEWWLALMSGLHVSALISAAGALLFRAVIMRDAADPEIRTITLIARASLLAAIVSGVLWLLMVTQSIAGASDLLAGLAVLPVVLAQTRFGQLLALRLVLLLVALATVSRIGRLIAVPITLSFAALVLQALLGHAAAEDGWVLPAVEGLHLIGAATWLGGLLPLLLLVVRLPAHAGVAAARRFSPWALASVVLIAGTALVQAMALIGSVSALTGTAYGEVALTKTALFACLLVIAALNRLVFIGSLGDRRPEEARRRLRTSIGFEIALGLAVVMTAGVLASLPPATEVMSMQQQ